MRWMTVAALLLSITTAASCSQNMPSQAIAAPAKIAPLAAAHKVSVFDAPISVKSVALPKDPLNPQASPHLTCSTYANFMVKEVDLGEKGAAKLAISAKDAPCQVDDPKDILVSDRIEGYFAGVKRDYVFFHASDSHDGGLPFYVFSADGKKLFEDSAADSFSQVEAGTNGLIMRFDRIWHAPCSLYQDKGDCANKVTWATGLGGPAGAVPGSPMALPDCVAPYSAQIKQAPQYAKQLADSVSVLRYPVLLIFDGKETKIMPAGGKPVGCSVPI